jgi:hypothetical protein
MGHEPLYISRRPLPNDLLSWWVEGVCIHFLPQPIKPCQDFSFGRIARPPETSPRAAAAAGRPLLSGTLGFNLRVYRLFFSDYVRANRLPQFLGSSATVL